MRISRIMGPIAAAVAAGAVAVPAASAQPVKPHLVPLLPTAVSAGQHAPVFVDAMEHPGHLLYRFDSVIRNEGGAVDLLALNPSSALRQNDVKQVLWEGGVPTARPEDPNADPSGDPRATVEDRTATAPGATILYDAQGGHHHYHFLQAAQYSLLVPHEPARGSGKVVGFCLVNSYGPFQTGAPSFFPETYTGSLSDPNRTWCQYFQSPSEGGVDPPLVRMGLSPGWGDYYESQDAGQWIDVTGLAPRVYTLTDTANPDGFIDVSPPVKGDDVVRSRRLIPGVLVRGLRRPIGGAPSRITLSGRIIGPAIPARASRTGRCSDETISPTTPLAACYRTARANGPLRFRIVQRPAHGRVHLEARGGLTATAVYTPTGGRAQADSFTYRAVDARGLASAPATVNLVRTR